MFEVSISGVNEVGQRFWGSRGVTGEEWRRKVRVGVAGWELVCSVSLATNCSGFGSLLPKIDFGNEHKLLS